MRGKSLVLFGASSFVVLMCSVSLSAANGDLRLVNAAKQQDVAAIRALLKEPGIDVNAPQGDGATALHWAAHWNDLDAASLLLAARANVNAVNDLGVTPLAVACQDGSPAMVEALLEAGANPNLAQASGRTPLMTAAWTGNLEMVRRLLAHKADVNAKEPERGQTALMWAISEGHRAVAEVLVESKADVRARSKSGLTPLFFAARTGNLEIARLLLAAGADVNESLPKRKEDAKVYGGPLDAGTAGASVLMMAVTRGFVDLATLLLEKGANPNADDAGYTTLHWAAGAWENVVSIAQIQPRGYADLSAKIGLKGQAKIDMVKALLAHGADPNAVMARPRYNTTEDDANDLGVDSPFRTRLHGATPFILAAAAGDTNLMRILLDAGADPTRRTREGTTPLMLAAGLGQYDGFTVMTEDLAMDAARMLVELGADVNAINDAGNTALHGAANMRYDRVIQFLVDHGANVNVKNADGQTPLMIALRRLQLYAAPIIEQHTSSGDLLRKLGAR